MSKDVCGGFSPWKLNSKETTCLALGQRLKKLEQKKNSGSLTPGERKELGRVKLELGIGKRGQAYLQRKGRR